MTKRKVEKKIEKATQLLALDLGCGENKSTIESLFQNGLITEEEKAGVVIKGVDKFKLNGVDVVHDLTKIPFPFKDNSVHAIFSSHFVEHLDGTERMRFMDECHRVLILGGRMRLIHPYYKSSRAVQDPTHKFPPICEESYLYYDKTWREQNKLEHYLCKCDFERNYFVTWMDNSWALKSEDVRNFAMAHYFNVIADLIVDLRKR